jgi:hypothetical protein
VVGVPAYLAQQIGVAVRVLDRNNPRHVRQFEAAERFRRDWRATRRALLREGRRGEAEALRRGWRGAHARMVARADRLFADAVADFDDARSGLHCSYRRGCRYFRLAATLERVLLLAAPALLSGAALRGAAGADGYRRLDLGAWELPRLATAAVVAAFFAATLAARPFASRLVSRPPAPRRARTRRARIRPRAHTRAHTRSSARTRLHPLARTPHARTPR